MYRRNYWKITGYVEMKEERGPGGCLGCPFYCAETSSDAWLSWLLDTVGTSCLPPEWKIFISLWITLCVLLCSWWSQTVHLRTCAAGKLQSWEKGRGLFLIREGQINACRFPLPNTAQVQWSSDKIHDQYLIFCLVVLYSSSQSKNKRKGGKRGNITLQWYLCWQIRQNIHRYTLWEEISIFKKL